MDTDPDPVIAALIIRAGAPEAKVRESAVYALGELAETVDSAMPLAMKERPADSSYKHVWLQSLNAFGWSHARQYRF